jgi:hypothetical protein
MPASGLSTLFSVPMTSIDDDTWQRENGESGLRSPYYVLDLGGLECDWYDGKKFNNNSHDMQLDVLPVPVAGWDRLINGGATNVANGRVIECDANEQNSCGYERYVNGSWIHLQIDNMVPKPGTNTELLPHAVNTLVAAIVAKIESAPPGPAPAPQHPEVALPATGASMITVSQIHAAVGVKATYKLAVVCDDPYDGPWEINAEAETEVSGTVGCSLEPPNEGQNAVAYADFEFLPAGAWAATKLESETPGETAVSVPGLPVGDSFETWTDSDGERIGDLVVGGNLIEIRLFDVDPTSEPVPTVSKSQRLINIAAAMDATIRG